jgi:hypothetical protein
MLIDDYVTELRGALSGPHGPKHDLVVEARDSLLDCAEAYQAAGLPREEAERRAVEEFGPVPVVAPGYQEELTASAGRRLGLLLFVSIPVTVVIWGMIWYFHPGGDAQWQQRPDWYMPASRLLDVLQLATGLYGGLALLPLVTRSLGLAVFLLLPLTTALGLLLSQASVLPSELRTFPPVVLANLVTYACGGMQIYCAIRCLRLSSRAAAHSR